MSTPIITAYFEYLSKLALPGVKAKAVQLARTPALLTVDPVSIKSLLNGDASEIKCKLTPSDRPVAYSMTLWPEEQDAHCNCDEKSEPCTHVLSAILILKNHPEILTTSLAKPSGAQVLYCFMSDSGHSPKWRFERRIGPSLEHWQEALSLRALGAQSLTSLVSGIQTGRIQMPKELSAGISPTQFDFLLDPVCDLSLAEMQEERKERPPMRALLGALRELPQVGILLDGKITRLNFLPQTTRPRLKVTPEGNGPSRFEKIKLELVRGAWNGDTLLQTPLLESPLGTLLLQKTETGLCAGFYESVPLLSSEAALINSTAQLNLSANLICEDLPVLAHKLSFTSDTPPELTYVEAALPSQPRLFVKREILEGGDLYVQASIRYKLNDPENTLGDVIEVSPTRDELSWIAKRSIADVLNQGIKLPIRNREAERTLTAEFTKKTSVSVGPAQKILAQTAASRMELLKPYLDVQDRDTALKARFLEKTPGRFEIEFFAPNESQTLTLAQVLDQVRNGSPWIKLGGQFAKLPLKDLNAVAEILKLALKNPSPYVMAQVQRQAPELFTKSNEGINKVAQFLNRLESNEHNDPGVLKTLLPAPTLALLRDYQLGGIQWLRMLKHSGLAALLADDMGLGKTLQALCAVTSPCLIVAPTSVLGGWAAQIKRFRPDLRYTVYHGSKRKLPPLSQMPDILLTTYGVLRSDRALLTETQWGTTILDEGQNIKNPEAQTSWAAHRLKADFKMLLSGTPIENRLEDIYSQFQYLLPGLLPDSKSLEFTLDTVKKRVRPFILRRTKGQVAKDLPPKTEMVLETELNPRDSQYYQAFLSAHQSEIQDLVRDLLDPGTSRGEGTGSGAAKSYFSALEILLRLRQSAVHPMLLPQNPTTLAELKDHLSSKFECLLESLEIALAEGHTALVFSQWSKVLDLLEPELTARGVTFLRIDGSVSANERERRVQEFEKGKAQVMLLTLKAGGVGLTLTAADHVYLLDPWWNPAAEDQASDRAHRIGQTRPVMVHRIIATGTIEQAILELQKEKRELAQALLSDNSPDSNEDSSESTKTSLSAQDLGRLLQAALDQ